MTDAGEERAGAVFAALADPTRRRVVRLLAERGGVTATEVAVVLPVTRQAVAKHLQALAEAGLVDGERLGRELRFRLTPEPFAEAAAWMAAIGAEWDVRLTRLRDAASSPPAPPSR